MRKETKNKKTEIKEENNIIAQYFEVKRNLRLLYKNLYESKTNIEADQNRLKALQYIFNTNILKAEYDKRLKQFERTYHTKKYKNCCFEIYKYIQKQIKELAKINNQDVTFSLFPESILSATYSVEIYNKNKEEYVIDRTEEIHYFDRPLLCIFESSGFNNDNLSTKNIYCSLDSFYYTYAKKIFTPVYKSYTWTDEDYKKEEQTEATKIRDFLFYILHDSNVEYKLAIRDYFPIYEYSIMKNDIFSFQEIVLCSSLCSILQAFDYYINELIVNNFNINNDISEEERAKRCLFEHPEYTIQEIADYLGKSKSTVEKQLKGKKKLLKTRKNTID